MRKILFLTIGLLAASAVHSQSVKSTVCTVSPAANDEGINRIKKFVSRLQGTKFNYYKVYTKLPNRTPVASGFPLRLPDGSSAVITDFRSLQYSDTAKVTFLNDDGTVYELDNLPVMRKKGNTEFILVKLPEDFKGSTLPLFTGSLKEGQEVHTSFIQSDSISIYTRGYIRNPCSKNKRILHTITSYSDRDRNEYYYGQPLLIEKNGTEYCAGIFSQYNDSFPEAAGVKEIQDFLGLEETLPDDRGIPSDINEAVNLFTGALKSSSVVEAAEGMEKFISLKFAQDYAEGLIYRDFRKLDDDETEFIQKAFEASAWKGYRSTVALYIAKKMKAGSKNALTSFEITKEDNFYKVSFSRNGKNSLTTLWAVSQGAELNYFEPLAGETLPSFPDNSIYADFDSFIGFPDEESVISFNLQGTVLMPGEGEKKNKVNGGTASMFMEMYTVGVGLFYQNEKTVISVEGEDRNCTMNAGGFNFRFLIPLRIWRIGVSPWVEARIGIANLLDAFGGDTFRIVTSEGIGLNLFYISDSFISPYLTVSAVNTSYNSRDTSSNISVGGGIRFRLYD